MISFKAVTDQELVEFIEETEEFDNAVAKRLRNEAIEERDGRLRMAKNRLREMRMNLQDVENRVSVLEGREPNEIGPRDGEVPANRKMLGLDIEAGI